MVAAPTGCTTFGSFDDQGVGVAFDFASAWEALADEFGDSELFVCGDVRRTWAEGDDRAARVAGGLRAAGLGYADNVGLCLYNGNEYLEAQWGAMKERCYPFNVNYRYSAAELRSLLDDADAKAVFYSAPLREAFAEIRGDLPELVLLVEVGGEGDTPDWAVDYEQLIATSEPAGVWASSPTSDVRPSG